MTLNISECELGDRGLGFLKDLVNYPDVEKLTQAILENETDFKPSHFAISWGGEYHYFIRDDRKTANADKDLQRLKRIDKTKYIPNDFIEIDMDVFESELFIILQP